MLLRHVAQAHGGGLVGGECAGWWAGDVPSPKRRMEGIGAASAPALGLALAARLSQPRFRL